MKTLVIFFTLTQNTCRQIRKDESRPYISRSDSVDNHCYMFKNLKYLRTDPLLLIVYNERFDPFLS